MKDNKVQAKKYIGSSFLAFGLFGLEIIIMVIEQLIYGDAKFFANSFNACALHWVITCIVWFIGGFLLCKSSKKVGFDILRSGRKPINKKVVIAVVILLTTVIIKTLINHKGESITYVSIIKSIKPITEYNGLIKMFPNNGIMAVTLQHIYYAFEVMLIVLSMVFATMAGNKLVKKLNIPWGGLFVGLTWGLMHILTQSVFTGIVAFIGAIIYGVIYLIVDKNVIYTYVFVFIMFVL